MSTRTIVEINHDFLHDLRKHPERFDELLMLLGSSEATGLMNKARPHPANLGNGIRLLGQRHHSETLMLEVK